MNLQIIRQIMVRDLERLKKEILDYKDEIVIWKVEKGIANSAGNLCLHLVGNLNTYIGAALGATGYVRNREEEFSRKDFSRDELVRMIEETSRVVSTTLDPLPPVDAEQVFPIVIFEKPTTTEFMLIHLSAHLNYHLGQVNYHRRLLDTI